MPEPQPERVIEPVRPAAMVNIAPDRRAPVSLTCDRCQGICEAGMRFCKFCGAPLPQGDAPAAPALQPERSQDYSRAASARQGLQAAIEEAARQAGSHGPKPVAQHVPVAPTAQGDDAQTVRRRGAHELEGPGWQDGADSPPETAKPTGGGMPFLAKAPAPAGRLVVIAGDGQEGPSFPLIGDQVDVGRTEGSVVLAEDRYMSPRHARLVRNKGHWYVRDLGSTNGVFVRISRPHDLVDSDWLLLGVEVLRFEQIQDAETGLGPAIQHGTLMFGSPALPRPARLVQRTVEGVARDVYHLHRIETVIGRESGDLVFTDDPYMSRRHALIRRDSTNGRFTLVDLSSSNGTFVAIRGDCPVGHGDSIRVGQHLFRIELAQA